jgi:hypothetical protein
MGPAGAAAAGIFDGGNASYSLAPYTIGFPVLDLGGGSAMAVIRK